MLQTAVFVDAGYLYKQGSAVLAGSAQPRTASRLNVPKVIDALIAEAALVEPDARLLRIYWYDGIARGRTLSTEQAALAQSDSVKCRFGIINSMGQQKGVDSLIVTDLVQLAREKAFSDALILAGDEDLRIGVSVAQTFGIRVHLLGIHPARGSQSPDLLAEADTTREWNREQVAAWLTVIEPQQEIAPVAQSPDALTPTTLDPEAQFCSLAKERVAALQMVAVQELALYVDQNGGSLPGDFDRPALGTARALIARDLTFNERRSFREMLREEVRARANSQGDMNNA